MRESNQLSTSINIDDASVRTASSTWGLLLMLQILAADLLVGHVLLWLGQFRLVTMLPAFVLAFYLLKRILKDPSSTYRIRFTTMDAYGALLAIGVPILAALPDMLHHPTGGDTLAYHLPMSAQWVQLHTMLAHDARVWFFPGNAELFAASLFLLTGNDHLWFVPACFAWLLAYLAITTILRQAGIRQAPLYAAALLLSPLYLVSLPTGGNDIFLAALLLSSVALTIVGWVERNSAKLLGAIAALSMVAGSKYSAPLYVPLLAFPLLLYMLKISPKWKVSVVTFCVAMCLLATSFYIRNAVLTGNPLYPTGLRLLGVQIFPYGPSGDLIAVQATASWEQIGSSSIATSHHLKHALHLLGHHTFRLAPCVPLLLLAGLVALAIPDVRPSPRHYPVSLALAAFLLVSVPIFMSIPFTYGNIIGTDNQLASGWSLRQGLPAFAAAFLLGASLLARIDSALVATALIIIDLAVAVHPGPAYWLSLCAAILLALAIGAHLVRGRIPNLPLTSATLVLVCIAALINASQTFKDRQQHIRADVAAAYGYYSDSTIKSWLDTQPKSEVIVASTSLRAYPLIGHHFERRVISVPLAESSAEWERVITKSGANYFVYSKEAGDARSSTFGTFPPQATILADELGSDWVTASPDKFTRVLTYRPDSAK